MELQIIRSSEFVRVGAHGQFDFESTRQMLAALAEACRKRGVNRALIDVRDATSNLSPNDLAALVTVFSENAGSKRLHLAIIHTGGDQEYRARLFAFFSGISGRSVRAFEDFEEGYLSLLNLPDSDAKREPPAGTVPIQFEEPPGGPSDSPSQSGP